MQNELFNVFSTFTKTALDTGRQVTAMNTRTYERLVKRRTELITDFTEIATKQGVAHYMGAQKQLAQAYADKAQQANKDAVKIIAQAQNELNQYLEQQLPAAMEQVRSAVQDATREAAESTRSATGKRRAT